MEPSQSRASISLVALCFVTVLGIAVASYLAVSNQAMKFSNRNYAMDVSRHLAEMGLEQALRAFNADSFSSWTLSGINASATLTPASSPALPAAFGTSGIVPSVKIRVYRYRSGNKGVVWNFMTNYSADDFVWHQGIWYLCVSTPSSKQAPSDTNYWTAAPEFWNPDTNYLVGNIAIYAGSAYRCIVANIGRSPPNATFWTTHTVGQWNSTANYAVNDVAMFGGIPYRCISANSNQSPPNTVYWLGPPAIYSEGIATLPDGSSSSIKTQLRAIIAPAPLFPNALAATSVVTLSTTGTVDSYNSPLAVWNSSYPYQVGDVVRVGAAGTTYYRCTAANTNASPPNASFWSTTTPVGFSAVIAGGNMAGTAVSVTSANVGGYIAAPSTSYSPYAAQASFGAGTAPTLRNPDGTVTSPFPTSTNIDLTRVSRSPYIPQLDIQSISGGNNLPASAGSGTTLNQGSITLGTAGANVPAIYNITATNDGGYPYPGLDLYQSDHDLTINGPVILNVSGMLRIRSGSIVISSTGSLEIYFDGQLDIGHTIASATAGIDNNTYDPRRLLIVGTNSTNTVNYHYVRTRRPLIGVIYMPNAFVTMSNGSFSNQLYGAISAKNIRFVNTVNFRYDTALRNAGKIGTFIDSAYAISQLRELSDATEKLVIP